MFVVGANQNTVPVPAAGFRWLDEQQHLTLEEVGGKPTEHPLGEEGPVSDKRLENPLVVEGLHLFDGQLTSAIGKVIVLYEAIGYARIPLFGEYLSSPDTSVCFGKSLA